MNSKRKKKRMAEARREDQERGRNWGGKRSGTTLDREYDVGSARAPQAFEKIHFDALVDEQYVDAQPARAVGLNLFDRERGCVRTHHRATQKLWQHGGAHPRQKRVEEEVEIHQDRRNALRVTRGVGGAAQEAAAV
jgi:hypothetical protein